MTQTLTLFHGDHRLAAGPRTEIVRAILAAGPTDLPLLVFDNATGRSIDLDLRAVAEPEEAPSPPARGRPKLGVVAREVTLLPRHWEWLSTQPGGASVALRKLVEAARGADDGKTRARAARDAAYHFMSAMAGNLPNFEEAIRALFADERTRFTDLMAAWPQDVRDHATMLALGEP